MPPLHPPPTSFPPPTHPDKWTSPSTATTYLSKVSQKKKKKQRAVKNFISWKWNLVRVQVSATTANIREHSKHRYIQPSCMAAERGLCARLPPSFGHYTALNIVGKDPTDQSTSWMSTTDEPSDHEPMFSQSSPCLATTILQDPLHFSHAWGHAARKYFSKTLQTLWSLANVRAASTMACYVAHSVRWTNFNFCDMAS